MTPLAVLPLDNPSLLQNPIHHSQEQKSFSQNIPVASRGLHPLGVMPKHHSFAIENLCCLRDLRTKPLQKPGQQGGTHWNTSKEVSV